MMSLKIGKQPRREEDGPTGLEVVAGNEDLLSQILLRLPVRSLLRFKSVSKPWLSLISSPQFCVLKSKRFCKHVSGLLLKPRVMNDSLRFNFVPLDHGQPTPFQRLDFLDAVDCTNNLWRLESVQCCNGLLLCQFQSKQTMHYVITSKHKHPVPETKYYVVNPTTKQHTAVPFTVKESVDKGLLVSSVALAFDPRKSPHFKIICLFHDFGSDGLAADFCVQIYSSDTGLFTQFSDLFRIRMSNIAFQGFFWNGAINWIDYKSDGLYFNVDEERFGILPMPPVPQNMFGLFERGISYYGESNDHLYFVQTDTIPTRQIDVYEMDREYSGWFVRFRVDLMPMYRAFPTKPERYNIEFSILAIVDKDDDEDSFIVFGRHCIVIRYHLKDRVFTRICDLSGVNNGGYPQLYHWSATVQFIESLHPLQNARG